MGGGARGRGEVQARLVEDGQDELQVQQVPDGVPERVAGPFAEVRGGAWRRVAGTPGPEPGSGRG